MFGGHYTIVLVLFCGACWTDFPESRFQAVQDGAASVPDIVTRDTRLPGLDTGGRVDSKPPGRDAIVPGDGRVDTAAMDSRSSDTVASDTSNSDTSSTADTATPDTGISCQADAFSRCKDDKTLVRCNATGNGLLEISCGTGRCQASLQRCDECDPTSPPVCAGNSVQSCSANGTTQSTTCALGCGSGACCANVDEDAVTTCDGDCNDNDPQVFPGQTRFFDKPSSGSFDYNCDKQEEREGIEITPPATPARCGAGCTGEAWVGPVACGEMGTFATCRRQGSNCRVTEAQRTRRCR